MSRPVLRRRPGRAVPATIVALALLAVGVIALWTVGQRLVTGAVPSLWAAPVAAADAAWASPAVWWVSGGALVLGVLPLVITLVPGAPSAERLVGTDDQHEVVVTRRGIARLVTTAAAQVSGVEGVQTSVGSRSVLVRVITSSHHTDSVEQRVGAQVGAALGALGLDPAPRVVARARTRAL